jgi:hypothetical protein
MNCSKRKNTFEPMGIRGPNLHSSAIGKGGCYNQCESKFSKEIK